MISNVIVFGTHLTIDPIIYIKNNNVLKAFFTIEEGITQGYQTVYVWVRSGNGAYSTDAKTCTYNYTTQFPLPYNNVSANDTADMKTRNFYVYAQVDRSTRATTANLKGHATP